MRSGLLHRVLLVLIGAALAVTHFADLGAVGLPPLARVAAGGAAGVGIGVVAALMGVAGGELLIPTIVKQTHYREGRG